MVPISQTDFIDEKEEGRVRDKRISYKGKKITIHDNRCICSHAAFCTDNLPSVFRMGVTPWIDADGEDPGVIKKVINTCPSGALSYSEKGIEYIDHAAEPEIHISRNGPYEIHGGVETVGFDPGDRASHEHYTLCRCGKSKNKPRCDGSHWYAAFKDDEALTISAANQAIEKKEPEWIKVANKNEMKNGETKPLHIHNHQLVLSKVNGKYGAIEGVCPHQGGPLMDGRIDNGVLRCPWHGHAFNPITGESLGSDSNVKAFRVEDREDGIYIEIKSPAKSAWTVSHIMVENHGKTGVFAMFSVSWATQNLGLAEAIRVQEEKGHMTYIGVRHEGAASFACSG